MMPPPGGAPRAREKRSDAPVAPAAAAPPDWAAPKLPLPLELPLELPAAGGPAAGGSPRAVAADEGGSSSGWIISEHLKRE